MNKKVYDIEIFKSLFTVIFYDGERVWEFSIYEGKNQLKELVEFLKSEQHVLIGYNNAFYDDVILNYLISQYEYLILKDITEINRILYSLSTKTIDIDNQDRKTQKGIRDLRKPRYFKSIDLMKVGGIMKSLKLCAVSLKHHRIQDLPYPFDKVLTLEEIKNVLEYNFNDVDITYKLYKKLEKQIELREYLVEQHGISSILTESDSGICNKIIDSMYSEITGMELYDFKDLRTKHTSIPLSNVIFDSIVFETQELQEFLEQFKSFEYYQCKEDKKFKFPILEFGNLRIQCGWGGIHSEDNPGVFDNSEYNIVDSDIGSMYPATIINHNIIAKHLTPQLITEYRGVRDERIRVKHTDKIKSDGLKIVLNSFFGKYGFDGSWLKDDEAMLKVTVNGQLYLLMLVEQIILEGYQILSINTDGILSYIPKDSMENYLTLCSEWEFNTMYELEHSQYNLYVRNNVNNYMSRELSGKIKQKGLFETNKGVAKGFDKPIVALALNEYFLNGIPVEQTIRNHKDIYDFCSAQKIGKSYSRVEYHLDDSKEEVQRSLRYYASCEGGTLYKVKWIEDKTTDKGEFVPAHESVQTLLSSSKVELFNDYEPKECFSHYDINYQYYIDECNKIICLIEGKIFVDREKLEEKIVKLKLSVSKNQAKYDNFIAKNSKSKAVETTFLMLTKQKEQLEELIKLR